MKTVYLLQLMKPVLTNLLNKFTIFQKKSSIIQKINFYVNYKNDLEVIFYSELAETEID